MGLPHHRPSGTGGYSDDATIPDAGLHPDDLGPLEYGEYLDAADEDEYDEEDYGNDLDDLDDIGDDELFGDDEEEPGDLDDEPG
jgi:hypothetical protein